MPDPSSHTFSWLKTGDEAYRSMLEAIQKAQQSINLETYSFKESNIGNKFRDALVAACQRGVQVRVVIDFLGSSTLRTSFWLPLQAAGGDFRWFNPWNLWRLGIRNHRKILVCDNKVAFLGGFNIAPEFEGDGIAKGWRDLGLRIEGTLANHLTEVFDALFAQAEFKPKPLQRLRKSQFNRKLTRENWTILLSGPGRGRKHLKSCLAKDMSQAQSIDLMMAYFLPTWKLRRELIRASRRTGRVNLILAGVTDLPFTRMAAQCLYRTMLKAGIRLYEYQPQILHAKIIIIDDYVYIGSANMDRRSLNINYEILLRIQDPQLAQEARDILAEARSHSCVIDLPEWRKFRPWWRRRLDRMAYYLLARIDPYLAYWKARDIP